MSISVFMDLLERRGVTFDLVDGVLCVEAPLGVLSEAQRHEMAARRVENTVLGARGAGAV